ncbi:Lytic polysaccharide monooxygenase AA9 [Pleurotus pulmonarius]
MKVTLSIASLGFFLGSVHAHAIFQELWVNGVSQGHNVGIRVPTYNGPITDVTSNDVICNGGINPFLQPMSQAIIDVPAGASVTAEWHHGGSGPDPNDASDPIDPSHKGPIIAYLAKVPSALQTDVTGLDWFKIYEDGYGPGTEWAVDRLIANKGFVTFKIPECIQNGEYLLRVELIALHGAGSYPGAQLYMECAQLRITGGGNAVPSPIAHFPGAYSGTDPGILIGIYYPPITNYIIPGPAVFTCGGTTPTSSSVVTLPSSSSSSSVVPPVTSTSTSSAPPQSTGTVGQWGQCGGIGYTGPTTCVAGTTCTVQSDYYYQCI